jgi:MFS family permease
MSTAATRTSRRDLRLLAAAVFLSAAGDLLAVITVALLVHDLTGSGVAVSAYFVAIWIPAVVVGPFAGLLADRMESVRLLTIASLVQAVLACALAFTGEYAGVLVLSALLAAGGAVSQPAEFTLVPAVAKGTTLVHANGVIESARYAGFTAGPLLAGAMALVGGAQTALLFNAATFVAIAVAATMLTARRPPEPRKASDRARDGITALKADRTIRVVVGASVGALFVISGSWAAEVFYVKDVLDAGDFGYALMTATWTVGMVVGATGLAKRYAGPALATATLVALAVQGAGMAAQTAILLLPFALAGYFVGGVGHGVKNTLARTLIAERIAPGLHGRAFAAYAAARNSAEIAAVGLGGLLVAVVGARGTLALAGLGAVAAAAAGLALLRARPAAGRGMSGVVQIENASTS